jgi:hypothetical protein
MNIFIKESVVDGRSTRINSLKIGGQVYSLSSGLATLAHLEDEWFDDVRDPEFVMSGLKSSPLKVDIFSFWQRLPETEPYFPFYREWESIAALPVTTFDHWWNKQIKSATRAVVRKAEKQGVTVRYATYDDDFVRGMTDIFNETPIRQGRRFWHYGKNFETVKQQFSHYLFREDILGAYYEGELIGFAMVGNAGRYGVIGQIISKMKHRNKSPNNALIAKAVEVCDRHRLPHLVYAYWGDSSLVAFKRHNGFNEIRLPRYYVALTRKGQLALRLRLHHGWKALIPSGAKRRFKEARSAWLLRLRMFDGAPID